MLVFQVSSSEAKPRGAVAEGVSSPFECPASCLVIRRAAFRLGWPRWIRLRFGLSIASFLGSFRRPQPPRRILPVGSEAPLPEPVLPASMAGWRSRPWIHAGTR